MGDRWVMGCTRDVHPFGLVADSEAGAMKKSTLAALLVIAGVLILIFVKERIREKEGGGLIDNCMLCHESQEDPSPSHPVNVLGCSICHLGNPFAREKDRAHIGLVLNPGDLKFARLACGKGGCHEDLPARVEKSIMATNRGILTALQARWPHEQTESVQEVSQLISRSKGRSMALDHYRKMCGGCHLWKTRSRWEGEIGKRGGGCTNCHILELSVPRQDLTKKSFLHPQLTTRIPNENCLKCHNRSARTGISYLGRFESEGYGTPFENGEPNKRRLSGGRFYLQLRPDVHHQKASLACIDCHTEQGVMGDGNSYTHMEDQVDITCKTCHEPEVRPLAGKEELAQRLGRVNRKLPPLASNPGVLSAKGSPLYHLRTSGNDEIRLYRKLDGKEITFRRLKNDHVHRAPYHERLTCQACHSAWMPQCYGCHVALLKGEGQKDWLNGQVTPGRWVEGRSYLRFERATLGIWPNGRIGPFAPGCQVFLDVFDDQGRHEPEQAHVSLTMASWDPHTTTLSTPNCMACHLDPKVLGLGDGSLQVTDHGLEFSPLYDSLASGLGIDFPLDAFVSSEGEPLQRASRKGSRPFNLGELKRITRVAYCLSCHDTTKDPIYLQWDKSLQRFQSGRVNCEGVK
jgi:hypothetical protein